MMYLSIECDQCGAIMGVSEAKENLVTGQIVCRHCELENKAYDTGDLT